MTLRYTPEAMGDLQELRDYIRKVLGNPSAAKRISRKLLDTCGHLKSYPMLGASVAAKTGQTTDLRYIICEKYIAFYRIDGDTISVARILDGRQDYLQILFDEKSNCE